MGDMDMDRLERDALKLNGTQLRFYLSTYEVHAKMAHGGVEITLKDAPAVSAMIHFDGKFVPMVDPSEMGTKLDQKMTLMDVRRVMDELKAQTDLCNALAMHVCRLVPSLVNQVFESLPSRA